MILSGQEISAQLGTNIVIDPFDPARLNPNSYNLTLHDELIVYEEVVLDMRKPNRFRRWGQPAQGEFAAGEITFERLEIARLDNDPSLPENGKLDFFMEGGL
jgi:deoxycytidine triphosphate deaminase